MTIKKELINDLLLEVTSEQELFGKGGLLQQLTRNLVEGLLEKEMSAHLGYEKHAKSGYNSGNSRNGKASKQVKTGNGSVEVNVPRDRCNQFNLALIGKRQNRLSELDDQIIELYGHGMTVRDISSYIHRLYGTEVSRDLISTVTDGVLEDVQAWRNRPLDKLYPIVYIDGLVVKCRLGRQVSNRTVYVVYGINQEGYKEVLGLYLGEDEGAKYWLSVLTEIKNRGVEDIFILCADGLKGLPEAVEAAFPQTTFQTCIVHLVRNSLRYVPHQDKKVIADALKTIYQAATLELAESALDDFELEWGEKYPAIVRSWRANWAQVIPFFDFDQAIRRIIYTTNMIESLNRTLSKSIKTRGQFSTEEAVMKVLYLTIQRAALKWNLPVRDWTQVMNQFSIKFGDRFKTE
ncbi:MAG: IS256 family transposase [Gammaproteobacteria bacterium]|nr:IS256 family transposase [Gammaproteobacteria bacterium]